MQIICATDFSEQSRAAIDLAVSLASALGDSVLLAHVIERPPILGLEPPATSWETVSREAAERDLGAAAAAMRWRGVHAEGRVLAGPVAEQLLALGGADGVRLMVLGSHGRQGASHLLLGSVAEDVARQAKRPVLITRGLPYPDDGVQGARRLRLVVLVDGTPAAEAALAWVKELRRSVACDITFVEPYRPEDGVLRFGLESSPANTLGPPALRPLLESELRRWVGTVPGEGEVHFRMRASGGDVEADLATEAELLQPDLVVAGIAGPPLGTRPQGFEPAALVRAMKLPVVCVPEALRPPIDGRIPRIRKVLVGTDLSDFSNQAVPAAYALLGAGGGLVEICCVREVAKENWPTLGIGDPPGLAPETRARIESKLAELAPPEAAARGIVTCATSIDAANATEGLRQEAERLDADVVVVASHGRTGVTRALMGSVSSELVKRLMRPVLVLHPPAR